MKYWLPFVFVLLLGINFGCKKEGEVTPDKNSQKVLGRWSLDSSGVLENGQQTIGNVVPLSTTSFYEFNEDHTFSFHVLPKGEKEYKATIASGNFHLSKDTIVMDEQFQQPLNFRDLPQREHYTILKISKHEMILNIPVVVLNPNPYEIKWDTVGMRYYYFSK